jgi:large conductance mechanosensitive channel
VREEFIAFLKTYSVIGLAIAVIIGGKANALVTSIVDGILMPIVTFFVPGGSWRQATLDVGPIRFLLGPVAGAAIDFLIVAWLVFWFSKKVLKEGTVAKK